MNCKMLSALMVVVALCAVSVQADVPRLMSYQGKLTDDTGVPVSDGDYTVYFRIYSAPSGGDLLWEEDQLVTVADGLFSVLLGDVEPIPDTVFTGPTRYLALLVRPDPEMTERKPIVSVGYAFHSLNADTAEYAFSGPGGGSSNWVVIDSVLQTNSYWGIARGGAGNVLYGDSVYMHVNLGVACTTGTSGQHYGYATVGGGLGNAASGKYATVGGGNDNDAGWYATVGGGDGNTADGICATAGGGWENTASGIYATVGGGWENTASGTLAAVGGGRGDSTKAVYGGAFSGYSNLSGDALQDTAVFVGGGYDNSATAKYATVCGGKENAASGIHSAVGGGYTNTAENNSATVGGGYSNTASSNYATVGGGAVNTANDGAATVSGGSQNTASGNCATVGGGVLNTASGETATVGGGWENTASEFRSVVAGGGENTASYNYATVSGGWSNNATGYYSAVAGGAQCDADGTYGFAAGYDSDVSSSYSNSAAFNGQTVTASSQTRVGNLSKASGTFTIDHPTDPANKILNHYFIESPEMVLIYRGVAVIGSDGRAEVHLPDYFDALNRNPMVQLTGVGTSDVYVSEEVTGNSFVIGGTAGTKVYWTVTGDRKDPSAEISRILMPVEQEKEGDLAGHSLDDDYLASTMSQLERMGKADEFEFRTSAGQEKYERSLRALESSK